MTASPSGIARVRFPAWLLAAALALVTIALYWPATGHDFISYDDSRYVTENPQVRGGLTWEGVKWAFRHPLLCNWHPVTVLSHMLDGQLFGLAPRGHHLTSVLLHGLNAMLVFVWLHQMTGARWRSLLVAALFAFHPLRVESVAWVAERKDVLSGCFGLLTLIFYARCAQGEFRTQKAEDRMKLENGPARASQSSSSFCILPSSFYLLSLCCFALGLMSKATLVTWPFVLLLLDYWPLKRIASCGRQDAEPGAAGAALGGAVPWRRLIGEKIPFFVLAAAISVVTYAVQRGAMPGAGNFPLGARFGNALVSYCRYLGKQFWPTDLAVFYPYPGHWPLGTVLGAGGLLLAISVLAFARRRRSPFLLMGWLWFVGTLVPMIGLVQVGGQAMADRYTYIPTLGVLVAAVWGAHELSRRWQGAVMVLAAAASAAIIFCLTLTRQQLRHWQDSETLFRQVVAATRDNYVAHKALGDALGEKGQMDEAIRQYQQALRLRPDDPGVLNNLGLVLFKQGQPDEAIRQYEQSLRLQPDNAHAHNNLGVVLASQGQTNEARRRFEQAVRLQADYAEARRNLGKILADQGQTDEAIHQFEAAIGLRPDDAETHGDLGIALGRKGRTDDAIRHYREAIRLKSGNAAAHYNLGNALYEKGQTDEAIRQFQEAVRLKPDDAQAHCNLGIALVRKGRTDEAIRQYQDAIRLDPDLFQPHLGLGLILPQLGRLKDAAFHLEEFLRTCPREHLEAPNSPVREPVLDALNDLAWLLATSQTAEDRDGARAVRFAERACALTSRQNSALVNTLAAAYAEAGRFKEAIEAAQQARTLAQAAGQAKVAEESRQLLELFQSGRPCREPPPASARPAPVR
ncbi:MAG TPA: tetratricopeptide repeat protein [Verrucomicrobiota bacterium]|nr:tetratricopeptide repeat protein [Verrucomicrobiota bacterium]